jgi:hypothetical protein
VNRDDAMGSLAGRAQRSAVSIVFGPARPAPLNGEAKPRNSAADRSLATNPLQVRTQVISDAPTGLELEHKTDG